MTLKQAVDFLGTLAVTGVTTNYGLDDVPGAIPPPKLPALVFDFSQPSGVIVPFDAALSTGRINFVFDHHLLVVGAAMKSNTGRAYAAIELIDNYLTTLKANWTMDGYLAEPLAIRQIAIGIRPFFGTLYHAVTFTHHWVLVL